MLPAGNPHTYRAGIPAQGEGSTVSFFIEARDDGGRAAIYPLVAPEGMMTFEVRRDVEAPELTRFTRDTTSVAQGPVELVVRSTKQFNYTYP